MPKILVISDSHGLTEELSIIRNRHADVDMAFHCGDSELSKDAGFLAGYRVVQGNCDWQGKFEAEHIVEMGGFKIYVTHGHLFHVKNSLLQLQYRAKELQADIVCFGHSHVAYAEKTDGILLINPGSIFLPRKYTEPTYAVMEWGTNRKLYVHYYQVNGEMLMEFPCSNEFDVK